MERRGTEFGVISVSGGAHIYFRSQAQACRTARIIEIEHDALALAQHPEQRALEGILGEFVLAQVGISHHDAVTTGRVVGLDDPLHGSQPALTILPARMHEVHTLTRLVAPLRTARTRWMLGFQRRLVRRWECDTDMPHEGPFPQISHTDAMFSDS